MHLIWILPGIMLAVSMYLVWRIRRRAGRELSEIPPSLPQHPTLCEVEPETPGAQARVMRWISIGEFMIVLTMHSDLLLIDLRPNALEVPFPVSNATILPVTQDELVRALESIPADRSVAFCGASNVSIFLIATSRCMEGSAPLFVLEGDPGFAEVA